MQATPEPVATLRDRQRVATRERLLRAALDEMRRVGVAAAQVDRIVAAARVSRGSFYFHFPTKDDVLMEWERRREAEALAQIDGSRRTPATLRAALLELVGYLGAIAGSADRRLLLETLAMHVRRAADPGGYPLLAEIERRLAAAHARRELRAGVDARQAAVLFLSNVFGYLVTRATARPPHPDAALLVDVFLTGVTARRRAAGPARARTRRSNG